MLYRYMTVMSRIPFPFAIDLMPNAPTLIVIKRSIAFTVPILKLRGWELEIPWVMVALHAPPRPRVDQAPP